MYIEKCISGNYPFHVLIVDDESAHRNLVKDILAGPEFLVKEADCGLEALAMIKERDFDAVLLDRRMPNMSGDEVCRQIRDTDKNHFLPVIMVTGDNPYEVMQHSMNGYANDLIRKPYAPVELVARVRSAALLKRKTDQLDNVESIYYALARMVETKDKGTGDHCNRLLHICNVFGRALGLTEEELFILRQGSVLHDIGKLGIPDSILLKQGLLDEDEKKIMRRHPVIGYELCKGLKSLRASLPIIRHHHERLDGSGYPDGLAGEEIPFLVRVFQIADIYDALANPRFYKGITAVKEIISIFNEESENGWRDPALVSVFIEVLHGQPDGIIQGEDMDSDMGRLMFENIISASVINPGYQAASSAGE